MAEAAFPLVAPTHLGSRDPASLFAFAGRLREAKGDAVEVDCQHLKFIDPLGFAVLGATLAPTARQISMSWLDTGLAEYMERMDFFHHCPVTGYSNEPLAPQDRRDNSVELTCISDEFQADETAERLANAITRNLTNADPNEPIDPNTGRNKFSKFSYPLSYSLSELLGNALTHAKRDGNFGTAVWVAAQVIKSTNTIQFSVVDNGCGMLGSLRKHSKLKEKTHEAAIRLALIPRVSCNRDGEAYTDHGNQGVGLTTTARISRAARGSLTIVSGNACVSTLENEVYEPLSDDALWNGVAISFQCRRGNLPAIRVSELLPEVIPSDIPIVFS